MVLPLGFEPKSPASEARILSIELRKRASTKPKLPRGVNPIPEKHYLTEGLGASFFGDSFLLLEVFVPTSGGGATGSM